MSRPAHLVRAAMGDGVAVPRLTQPARDPISRPGSVPASTRRGPEPGSPRGLPCWPGRHGAWAPCPVPDLRCGHLDQLQHRAHVLRLCHERHRLGGAAARPPTAMPRLQADPARPSLPHARHCQRAHQGKLVLADFSCAVCRIVVDTPTITCWRWTDRPALVHRIDDLPTLARAAKVDIRFLQLLACAPSDRLPAEGTSAGAGPHRAGPPPHRGRARRA
jgi:hypothetical protein